MTTVETKGLADELLDCLIKHELWVDCRIYFNGMAYSTDDNHGRHSYNNPRKVYKLTDIYPQDFFDYNGDILSMSFEGPLYEALNGYLGAGGDEVERELSDILEKHGLYYELGNAWNLSVYEI